MSKFKIGNLVKGIENYDDVINKDLLKAEILGYMGYFSDKTKIKILEHNNAKYIGDKIYYVDEKLLGYYNYPDDSNNKRKPRNGYRPVTIKENGNEINGYLIAFNQEGNVQDGIGFFATVELEDGKVYQYDAYDVKFDDV